MNIPEFPKFKELELCDHKALAERFAKYPQTICEMNFVNLYIWRRFDHYKLTRINDNLCVHCSPQNESAFFFAPISGKKISATIQTCLDSASRLSRVPEEFIEKYAGDKKGYAIYCDRNNYDYVYLAADLIELKGKKYDGKRNHIKRFKKKYAFEYRRLSKTDHSECANVLKIWGAGKKHLAELAIKSQADAVNQIFERYDELGIIGGGIAINGRIEGFSLASQLNPETADIHIEIANPAFAGLSQTLNNEVAKNELTQYKYINREQDLGLPGIRAAKLSYHPSRLERKFDIIKT